MRIIGWCSPHVPSLLLLGFSTVAAAEPCTDGIDCFCDRVEGRGPQGTSDPSYVLPNQRATCVDWEEATLASTASLLPITSDTINAGGQNVGRPWDATHSACGGLNRGGDSWFYNRYGNGSGLWKSGEPASPARGVTCGCGPPFQGCTGTRAFHPSNFWGAGNNFALAIRRSGEETLFEPAHGLVPILFGNQDAALISMGGSGYAMIPPTHTGLNITEFGFTEAIVYSENYLSQLTASGTPVGDFPIKGNEFSPGDWWLFGRQGNSPKSEFPFSGFFFYGSAGSETACNALLSSGQLSASVGSVSCISTAIVWHSTNAYDQPTDWAVATKGCVRAELTGIASGTMRLREWFQHSTDSDETLVLDMTLKAPADFVNFKNVTRPWFDLYTNGLESQALGGGGPAPDGRKHYRIEDNIVSVQNRPALTCAQIGFSTEPPPPRPAAPTSLTVK